MASYVWFSIRPSVNPICVGPQLDPCLNTSKLTRGAHGEVDRIAMRQRAVDVKKDRLDLAWQHTSGRLCPVRRQPVGGMPVQNTPTCIRWHRSPGAGSCCCTAAPIAPLIEMPKCCAGRKVLFCLRVKSSHEEMKWNNNERARFSHLSASGNQRGTF